VYCWVDSVAGVDLLSARTGGRARRLPVLVEVGIEGGRTGARDIESALAVARAVSSSSSLRLAGVSFFEGIIKAGPLDERLARITDLIALVRRLATDLERPIADDGGSEIILSGGGSRYTDLVASALSAPLGTSLATRAVLRCGSTVMHDDGGYDATSPFGPNGIPGGPRLRPALEVWAPVLSLPEPGLAIAGAGKRDVSFDWDTPPVLAIRGQDGVRRRTEPDDLRITNLNDQHAYVAVAPGLRLAVGDLISMGVRHVCTGMDRWTWLPVIDDDDAVIDAFELIF
jgi:D-serine deaminase-like pyridoxal phosphate-dependent protein